MYTPKETRYDAMQFRRCGASGLKLPLISLGLWHNFGSVNAYQTAKEMLYSAFDNGITHFDAANNYGPVPGSAEITLGRVLKDGLRPYRDELVISTKAGYDMWDGPYGCKGSSRKYLLSSLDQSLKRMGLDYVDIFYSHCYNEDTPLEETMGALATAVRQGKALYVGISSYSPEQTKAASDLLRAMGVPCLIHQPRYSMLDRSIENGLQDVLTEEGIGSIAFCPLAQGLLTSKYLQEIPNDSRAAGASPFLSNDSITPQLRSKLLALNGIAQGREQSLAQMALSWVLRDGKVTSALIGASRPDQIVENVKALDHLEFSAGEIAQIDAVLA